MGVLATDGVGYPFAQLFWVLGHGFRLIDDNEIGLYTVFVGLNELRMSEDFSVYGTLFKSRTGNSSAYNHRIAAYTEIFP